MSRDIWVCSDHHFSHANIIMYSDRPFRDVVEMNETLVQNHNQLVKPTDIVYFLGDVFFGNKKLNDVHDTLLSRMHGHKRLILGNHDDGKSPVLQKNFDKILMWRMFPDFRLLLTHVPVHKGSFKNFDDGTCTKNIHGHLHQNLVMTNGVIDNDYRNVCVEHTNYFPVNLETLRITKT